MRATFRHGTLKITGAVLGGVIIARYRRVDLGGADSFEPEGIYRVLRAAAWVDAAASFDNKPITLGHVSRDDAPNPEQIVGVVRGVRFRDPYLRGTVAIWGRQALDGIARGELRALSIGYEGEVEPRAGTFRGQAFDARCRWLEGHHVALVDRSRNGAAVVLRLPGHVRDLLRRAQWFI